MEKRANNGKSGPSAEDKALDLFASMMIEKIESLSGKDGWKKPWFTDGALSWPKNLSGREYNGMNAMFLMMAAEKNGYKLPVWGTFNRFVSMNEQKDKQGNPLPHVGVNKGEKSMPVFLTTFTVVDKDTKEKIPYDDYKRLSEDDKQRYNVYPKMNVYNVFSVEQTNLREARPELWAKLEAENTRNEKHEQGEQFTFEPVDTMIRDGLWICPIKPTHQDSAYYSLSKDEIVVPEKSQFKDGESFYGTLFHEMTHSTGKEGVLDRIKPSAFGSDDYGREELVAEMGSALVAQRYGMSKHLKEDSASYLKSWLDSLKESPQFLKTTLVDVKKATSLITQRIDKVALDLREGRIEGKEMGEEQSVSGQSVSEMRIEGNENVAKQSFSLDRIEGKGMTDGQSALGQSASEGKEERMSVFYSSVAYLQMADDTQLFDRLQENGDYRRILQEAAEYDSGDAIDMEHTNMKATQYAGDDLLAEDDHYAVVYNNRVGGTYEVLRKVTEQDVREAINRYGLPNNATDDVKKVATVSGRDEGKTDIYYSHVADMMLEDETHLFNWMNESGGYRRILQEAAKLEYCDGVDLYRTRKNALQYEGDDVVTENEDFAVVYNWQVGGTYKILRKVTEQDVREAINRYGLPNDATDDVKKVATSMTAEEFAKMEQRRVPAFEMDSGDVLYLAYNSDTDSIDVGTVANAGLAVKHSFAYDHSLSLDMNLQGVHEQLSEMEEYQGKQEEEEVVRSGFRR